MAFLMDIFRIQLTGYRPIYIQWITLTVILQCHTVNHAHQCTHLYKYVPLTVLKRNKMSSSPSIRLDLYSQAIVYSIESILMSSPQHTLVIHSYPFGSCPLIFSPFSFVTLIVMNSLFTGCCTIFEIFSSPTDTSSFGNGS